jgi:hypothetical protein
MPFPIKLLSLPVALYFLDLPVALGAILSSTGVFPLTCRDYAATQNPWMVRHG